MLPNKKLYSILVVVIFFIVGVVVWGINQEKANAPTVSQETASQQNQTADIIYFYGETCSHCIELNKFLEDNKIAEKVNFSKKEVWSNKDNTAEMEKRAAECNIQKSDMGVPFVYARGKCYVGTPQAEAFFKQEAGIQ